MNSLNENELDKALENNMFYLNFQPIYCLELQTIVAVEVLLRWEENKYTPDKFINFAEKSGQITRIDQWVINETFKFISKNTDVVSPIIFCINLSVKSICNSNLVEYIKDEINQYHINASMIELEVTEHSMLEDIGNTERVMNQLKEMGFRIVLDDFGTRYSSLNYLAKLPFDVLKIDKTYIDSICNCRNSQIIVGEIIILCKKLGLVVIAEGIETKEQELLLNSLECQFGQGYLFSRPIKGELIIDKLKKQTLPV